MIAGQAVRVFALVPILMLAPGCSSRSRDSRHTAAGYPADVARKNRPPREYSWKGTECPPDRTVVLKYIHGGGHVAPWFEFTNPLGWRFLLVDERGRFWADTGGRVVVGELPRERFAPLMDAARGVRSSTEFSDPGCVDGPSERLTVGEYSMSCYCGCDPPPGAPDVSGPGSHIRKVYDAVGELMAELGTGNALGSNGAQGPALLLVLGEDQPHETRRWPLSWDPGAVAYFDMADAAGDSLGRVLRVPEPEAQSLRSLRDHPGLSVSIATASGRTYKILIVDELVHGLAACPVLPVPS